jgi:hypothetical protein
MENMLLQFVFRKNQKLVFYEGNHAMNIKEKLEKHVQRKWNDYAEKIVPLKAILNSVKN